MNTNLTIEEETQGKATFQSIRRTRRREEGEAVKRAGQFTADGQKRGIMMQRLLFTLLLLGGAIGLGTTVLAQGGPPKDNMIDGERYPAGYTPMEIKNGVYPRVYTPNTEKLGPKEMRLIALGTGMPNVITGKQKASGWYLELGNGSKFMFDLGSGTMENLAKLRPDWSKVDKVFASHLHSDHVGAFAELYIGGWMNGRYTPLHFYGPSGSEPRLGTKAFVDNQVKSWAWDIEGRRTAFPIEGGKVIAHEFDFRNEGVIYEDNGVKISEDAGLPRQWRTYEQYSRVPLLLCVGRPACSTRSRAHPDRGADYSVQPAQKHVPCF